LWTWTTSPPEDDPLDDLFRSLPGPPHGDDVHLEPAVPRRSRLGRDARLIREVAVKEHEQAGLCHRHILLIDWLACDLA
jgi:hypothetical protein